MAPSRNQTVRQPTSSTPAMFRLDPSITPIRYAAKGIISRPPMEVPAAARPVALLLLRRNQRTTRASMLVIDAALRQVLITMENTTMNHSRSNGMLTTPRLSEWFRSWMNARLMIARPIMDSPIPKTRRGPYLSNSAPMMGCMAPLMRKPTEPTQEISERSHPNVGSISVTKRPNPWRPGIERKETKKQVATIYQPKYIGAATGAADLDVIRPLVRRVP